MNAIITDYTTAALVFSILSLALIVPVLITYRHYFRSLDFLQMSFIFAASMYKKAFSSKLYVSMMNFNHNLFTFCTTGDMVCTLGFQLSFGVILLGIILLARIFLSIKKCCGPSNLQFQTIYSFFKGFFRFIYLPMVYYATSILVRESHNFSSSSSGSQFISSAAIIGFFVLFPLIQLIGYKCIQPQQPIISIWNKWIEFFGYYRLLATGGLLGLYAYYTNILYLHCTMISLILYSILFVWKGQFSYPISQRIISCLGQAAFLANFYIFKYHTEAIQKYDIDFFLLGFVIVIDAFLYLVRSILMSCYGKKTSPKVHIELNQSMEQLQLKKTNKYDPLSNIQSNASKRKK